MNQIEHIDLCDPYFWEQPSILIGSAWWKRWERKISNTCASEIVNEIAVIYIFTIVFSIFISVIIGYPYGVPIALLSATSFLLPAFVQLYNLKSKGLNYKKYINLPNTIQTTVPVAVAIEPFVDNINETLPSAMNPFMNVSVNDIKYNPHKPAAAPITSPEIQDTLDSFFRVQWISDPTDVFGKTQSQREFITMPSTSIPNDQGSYQDWLYKIPGKTCKEGGREACIAGTDGGPLPWLNQDL